MKKRLLILVGFLLYLQYNNAQTTESKPQVFMGNAVVDYETSATGSQNLRYLQMQIGSPLPTYRSATTNNTNIEIGFPYNVLYIPLTFVVDDFEISKGYFSEHIKLSWRIGANEDLITSIEIKRRVLSDDTTAYETIANLSPTTFEYFDTQVEGGVLFEYQVIANGIPLVGDTLGERTLNYMDGIGYRNPTATVSGSVSFDSGSPVQDVTVLAEANGEPTNTAKSIHFQEDAKGALTIENIDNIPADKITLQAWVTVSGSEIPLFELKSNLGIDYQFLFGRNGNGNLHFFSNLNSASITQRFYLQNYYPTGELDAAGNDILKRTDEIEDKEFVHVSIIIENEKNIRYFINGREINQEYIDSFEEDIDLFEDNTDYVHTSQTNENFNYLSSNNQRRGKDFRIDELRAWNTVLSNEEIRRDYRRTLDGSEGNLAVYLRMDEGTGEFLYDLSKVGFNQNSNDAYLSGNYTFDDTTPTYDQLGVFGVTDANGSYIISGLPFKGTGESFVITPSLGVHQFEPASQTLFLGKNEPVANQVNFKDISSFNFNGKVVYNVQDVFNPIPTASTNPTDLRDYGYNKYLLGNEVINKGEYYYEGGSVDSATGFYKDGALKQYPVIGVEGASILIDGNPVFDADNQLVLSDSDGNFKISVPIGNHKIEVVKDGHVFELDGRFPEEGTFSFFKEVIEPQYFIDKTRVSLVGRVVGGKNEFEKPIGFGFDGLATYVNNEGETTETTEIISSVNNIGVAEIIFRGDVNSDYLDKTITTNSETGEYKVDLIPYQYTIETGGIDINENEDINIIDQENESLDLREVPDLSVSEYTTITDETVYSDAYHYVKNFRYNSPVTLLLKDQEYEKNIRIGGHSFDISNLDNPIYLQNTDYSIYFEVSQEYTNYDNDEPVTTQEYFTEGTFNITNNLAEVSGEIVYLTDKQQYKYTFSAGYPNISQSGGFKKGITIGYDIPGQASLTINNETEFKNEGIIKGAALSGGIEFQTVAPEIPELILRDPPGTNSFASIETGSTVSFEQTTSNTESETLGGGLYVSAGPTWEVSTGGIGILVGTETNIVADAEGSYSRTETNTGENTTAYSYTFNRTISTSSEPDFVGAEGDLYIGNAKNIYYGEIDNMFILTEIPKDNFENVIPNIEVTGLDLNNNPTTLYICYAKDFIFIEQPTNTFYTYSQKHIIETLIPGLDDLAANLSANTVTDPDSYLSPEFYTSQANLWRKVIQNNEKAKYEALNDKDGLLDTILEPYINSNSEYDTNLRSLIDENFFSNKSFDAGVGELTNSVTSTNLTSNTQEYYVDIDEDFKAQFGFLVNNVGAIGSVSKNTNSVDTDAATFSSEDTSTISYTLKDSDRDNVLSVDVINLFDGNGPVFVTKGGATSCPYEGPEVSIFYNNTNFDETIVGQGGETLSYATNRVYNAELSVVKDRIVNVPEDDPAVFTLLLKNTSETQSDLEYVVDFDSASLNGADINIETNGENIYLPFGTEIEFPIEISKSSVSSTYLYEDIKIFLYSPCATIDEKYENPLNLSVEFKKSCSNVSLSAPETNWIFNANEAYTIDANGNTTSNTLPITFTDFNTDFNGFERISLQYRNANSSSWTKLQSYYGSESLKDEAGDNEGIVISGSDSEFTFNWDVVGNNIPDGDYEFRAVSFCTDNISNASEISSGVINLTAPVVFGTPQPSDGILDVGEDVSVRFNEDIFEGTTTSVTVSGLKNQQEVDNSVSVFLDGTANQMELPQQVLQQGSSLTLQFWYKNATTGSGTLVTQEDGFNIAINGNHLDFSIGGQTVSTTTSGQFIDDSQYNFYSFVYQKKSDSNPTKMLIFENGTVLEELNLSNDLDINTDASLFIGGNNVTGNIHNIRMWSQSFTPAEANVAKDLTLTGRELNLTGYWKLDEGYGTSALDLVKRRNAIVNLDWDIFPKGTSWEFKNNEFLKLDNVNSVQISEAEDITLSFWIRAIDYESGTVFSNGFGDDRETVQTNGFRNRWSVNLKVDGHLELQAEDTTYPLTTSAIPASLWTHVAIVLRRGATLKSFINGEEITSVSSRNLGGLYGNNFLVGARLNENTFEGFIYLDEIRLWNTARSTAQIKRDRYFEIDKETDGLMLYMDFNEDPNNTSAGPAYHHAYLNETISTTFSIMRNGSTQRYRSNAPALKPQLQFTNIPYSTVINGDEMIITPTLTEEEWTLFEGQEINFTVSRLTDQYFNQQLSPVNWTALVNRQELEWFTEDNGKEIDTEKNVGEAYSFTMTINNIGGSTQPYSISGIPVWMQTDSASGSVPGNSSREITFIVDEDLAMGSYTADIVLQTASGYNDRLDFSLRALQPAPDWSVNPRDFDYSINAIGQIQINGVLSRDKYTKVGAFVNNEQRGEAILTYDEVYDSYFVFLTAYSNSASGDEVTFKIWDAIEGKSLIAKITGTGTDPETASESVTFITNKIFGRKSVPVKFVGDVLTEQSITLNKGWTWTSFFVNDSRLSNISGLFSEISDYEEARIANFFDFTFLEDEVWNGSLTTLSSADMYKIKLSEPYELKLSGVQVDETDINFTIYDGWNWLPFPIHKNVSLLDALAFYEPTDGDVIKDQFNFAIYDVSSGWSGTLDYLVANEGYMLRSYKGETQVFNYPDTRDTAAKTNQKQFAAKKRDNSFRQFEYNMNIVAEITTEETFDNVLVMDMKGELRGRSEIVDINGKRYSFITAFSNDTESLQFVLENSTDQIYTAINTTFINNAILGTMKNPFQINLNSLSNTDSGIHSFAVYPNPFKDEVTVNFSNNTSIETIEVYTVLGISVIQQNVKGLTNTIIDTKDLAIGVYLIKVTTVNGESMIQKIIKR